MVLEEASGGNGATTVPPSSSVVSAAAAAAASPSASSFNSSATAGGGAPPGSASGALIRPKACRTCGQAHSHHEPHLYNYKDEVDEDMMCQICLQPFVEPLDTPCGHTFCRACLVNYLRVNPMCPLDRKPLNEMICQPSNLVLKRLLDKQTVTCPNGDSCSELLQRGNLSDHLKYRCSGTMVACQYAGGGCDFRGPKKSMQKHQEDCKFQKEGISRLPVLEGEVSHVEIPRTNQSLGITIVGGADTPLRCVVIQEVYPEGLVSSDGRLQPGDQIVEINGVDMTCSNHAQVCAALRKMTTVLRLGVYRERVEKYPRPTHHHPLPPLEQVQKPRPQQDQMQRASLATVTSVDHKTRGTASGNVSMSPETSSSSLANGAGASWSPSLSPQQQQSIDGLSEGLLSLTLEHNGGKPLGICLSGGGDEAGVFIADVQENSVAGLDGRLRKSDKIISINGQDVRKAKLGQASALIQGSLRVHLTISRKAQPRQAPPLVTPAPTPSSASASASLAKVGGLQLQQQDKPFEGHFSISHMRSKSAPAINHNCKKHLNCDCSDTGSNRDGDVDDDDDEDDYDRNGPDGAAAAATAAVLPRPHFTKHYAPSNGQINQLLSQPLPLPPPPPPAGPRPQAGRKPLPLPVPEERHYDVPEGADDYMAIYETIDRKRQMSWKNKSHSMEALETPTPSEKNLSLNGQEQGGSESETQEHRRRHRSKPSSSGLAGERNREHRRSLHSDYHRHQGQKQQQQQLPKPPGPESQVGQHQQKPLYQSRKTKKSQQPTYANSSVVEPIADADETDGFGSGSGGSSMTAFLRKAIKSLESMHQQQQHFQRRSATIKKTVRESLGMRIGGGIGSNEGDTPIYIANIHPHGCIGKSKLLKKGDLLLSVDDTSLCGLTHSQAVSALKATIANDQVVLGYMEGPETSFGASNFIPSWMFWQKLPRFLQYPKTVILHRRLNASWGFSIVGGVAEANGGGKVFQPIHVLFVVPDSPASKGTRLKCGDRILAVDGHSMENMPHHLAVKTLKETSTRVALEVVSWTGTEL